MKESENIDEIAADDVFLTAGAHIGTKQKSKDMQRYIFKVRNDGLYVLNIQETKRKLTIAGKFLATYDPKKILVISARQYGQNPAKCFAEVTGATWFPGRYMPGSLTNSQLTTYLEPEVLIVTDPAADLKALKEAVKVGVPVVGLCDANNYTRNVDLVIPINNKGRKSLALVYWLLAREVLINRGLIKSYSDFNIETEAFETII